jgi:hypothetical protein
MNQFDCKGYIQIYIDQTARITKIKINHKCLHLLLSENNVSEEIKTFIQKNIDLLLLCKIYAKLINKELDLFIKQSQVHFYWIKLNKNKYIRYENAFQLALL